LVAKEISKGSGDPPARGVAIVPARLAYHTRVLSAFAGVLAVAIALQSAPTRSSSGGNAPISPTVFATWLTERIGNGPVELRLLVLWRGTPGWYFVPGGGIRESSDGARRHQTIEYGDIRLTLDYGAGDALAINGRRVHLGADNVVYVDDVDAVAGARVVRTSRIPSKLPGSAGQIGLAIRDLSDVVAYLKCDARASDAQRQMMIEQLAACVATLGK